MNGNIQCGWVKPERWPASAVAGLIGASVAGLIALIGFSGFGAAAFGAATAVGFVWGYCLNRLFRQLTLHQADVCIAGLVDGLGQDTRLYLAWLSDPDKTFNLIVLNRYISFVTDNTERIRCTANNTPVIHCEVVSAVQRYAAIGGMIGAAGGAVIGTALGIAAASSLSCGPFAFICLIIAVIVALVVALVVTAAGSWIGGEVGVGIGVAIDNQNDLLGQRDRLSVGDCVTVQGDWVIDNDSGWNEIHPVKALKLAGQISKSQPFDTNAAEGCPDDCPSASPPIG